MRSRSLERYKEGRGEKNVQSSSAGSKEQVPTDSRLTSAQKEYGFVVRRHVRCVCACAWKLVRHRVVIPFRVNERDGKDVIVIRGVVSILTSIFDINIVAFLSRISTCVCVKLEVNSSASSIFRLLFTS